jgi:signal transduction histidine kinase
VTWLDAGGVWSGDPTAAEPCTSTTGVTPPAAELQGCLTAGGGPVVTAALNDGEHLLGALTIIRRVGRPDWTPVEVRLVESIAADIGRGVQHARLYQKEKQLVAQLKDVDTAKSDFVSTVSHELRTPLTSIAGYLEMLREDPSSLNPLQTRMLDVIDRNTRRLRMLIEDLLLLSRIESGSLRGLHRSVDLATVVQQAAVTVADAATKASVALHTDVEGPLPVRADPDQLDRVLANLLSNAVKFTAPQGRVSVTGRRDGDDTVITVSDTGMGIPAAEQPALFARFFRASNAVRQAVPGTGLGLAIVRTIVDNHGGHIEVRSTEGVGTAVTVRLPTHE